MFRGISNSESTNEEGARAELSGTTQASLSACQVGLDRSVLIVRNPWPPNPDLVVFTLEALLVLRAGRRARLMNRRLMCREQCQRCRVESGWTHPSSRFTSSRDTRIQLPSASIGGSAYLKSCAEGTTCNVEKQRACNGGSCHSSNCLAHDHA
jgi:hypothetical protein